jgi:hypothetical protein
VAHPFLGQKLGCGDLSVYRANPAGDKVLEISVQQRHAKDTAYDITIGGDAEVAVRIYSFARQDVLWDYFCNDIENDIRPVDTLHATAGTLRIRVYDYERNEAYHTFQVDVEGRNILFGEKGADFNLESIEIDSVMAGWTPG